MPSTNSGSLPPLCLCSQQQQQRQLAEVSCDLQLVPGAEAARQIATSDCVNTTVPERSAAAAPAAADPQ
jgi:hypothetical protein